MTKPLAPNGLGFIQYTGRQSYEEGAEKLFPNMRRLANGSYLVRTQAGFKKAMRDYFNEHQLDKVSDIAGYPKAYPSVVRFNFLYGWNEPQAYCTPLNQYQADLRELLVDLADE